MLLVKILDFKDLGVQKKRNVKWFFLLLLLITYWNDFFILGWIKISWNFFLSFTMKLLENMKLYVQLTLVAHMMLM